MDLEFNVNNQVLKRTDSNKPANLSSEYLKCIFNFESDDWESMGKFAIFKAGTLNYRVAINDDECIVPFDALQHNRFALTVYGVDGDVRITTNIIPVNLGVSGFVSEYDESSYFNPDMTEELLDLVEQKVYISVFDETVTNINESISGLESSKLDKTTYNTDIPVIRSDITDLENSKVDNTTFNDTVESINTSIGELDTNKTVTITKQATADTGYFSTYLISQGGIPLSPKINIPKDYLLKSASLKQCTVKDEPIEGLNVGNWYFDWVLNTADETEESHLYLNANVLTDVYEADNETIIITDNVISVKPNVFAFKSHTHSKSDITDFNHTHTKSDITNFNHTHTESEITDLKDYALNSDVYSKNEVDQLIYDLNNNMNVTSDKNIVQTEETSNITVQVKENGFPAINKTVNIYMEE
ncbi:hypothetical protein [uncultured Methanobrevibacter sp.]|uniref:hypothetical protein n=1 Tax=uncultured Methanobrevibacter sp. TaxID=253161 RepID=UPI0025F2E365|nr:hypothetical protein [uncultured Methanobrevibacter sp.]